MLNLNVETTEVGNRKYKALVVEDLSVMVDGEAQIVTFAPKTVTRMTDHFETLSQAVGVDKANNLIHNFLIEKIANGADLSKYLISNGEQFSTFLTLSTYQLDNYGKTEKTEKSETEPKTRKARVDKNARHIASAMAKLSVLFVPEGTEVTRERIEAGVDNLRTKISEGFDWSNVTDQAYEFASQSGLNDDGSIRRRKAATEEAAVTV